MAKKINLNLNRIKSNILTEDIDKIFNKIKSKDFNNDELKHTIIVVIRLLRDRCSSYDEEVCNTVMLKCSFLFDEITNILDSDKTVTESSSIDIYNKLNKLLSYLDELNVFFRNERNQFAHNSEEFYTKQINDLNIQIDELNKKVIDLNQVNERLKHLHDEKQVILQRLRENQEALAQERKSTTQNEARAKELQAENKKYHLILSDYAEQINDLKKLQKEYLSLKDELTQTQDKLAESQKQNDQIKNWNTKIQDAFNHLKTYVKPIENEKLRLKILFYSFLALSLILILFLGYSEYLLINKIHELETISIQQYLYIIMPVPIAAGLLWGFITQMNRAQRQLIILTKQIHEINYIEGLLLTLNTLSVDVNDSIIKVNTAINKLIDIHLNRNIPELENEETLTKELKKDSLPYESVEKLLEIILKNSK